MDTKLTNKLALVSGSTAGIGYAIAVAPAAEGARVIVNGRSQASVDGAVARINSAATERGSPGSSVPARNEAREPGADHLHFQ
jgi:NAD(P)-dependent dehydrogenase (short-subunit alcohol dehydrogenase family)